MLISPGAGKGGGGGVMEEASLETSPGFKGQGGGFNGGREGGHTRIHPLVVRLLIAQRVGAPGRVLDAKVGGGQLSGGQDGQDSGAHGDRRVGACWYRCRRNKGLRRDGRAIRREEQRRAARSDRTASGGAHMHYLYIYNSQTAPFPLVEPASRCMPPPQGLEARSRDPCQASVTNMIRPTQFGGGTGGIPSW